MGTVLIEETTMLRRNPDQEFSKIDDEVVMLSKKNGEYYALNSVGSRIWEIIENPITVKEVLDKLNAEFEIGHDICATQTIELLNEMNKKSLIELC